MHGLSRRQSLLAPFKGKVVKWHGKLVGIDRLKDELTGPEITAPARHDAIAQGLGGE
jgi:hypothetical protein